MAIIGATNFRNSWLRPGGITGNFEDCGKHAYTTWAAGNTPNFGTAAVRGMRRIPRTQLICTPHELLRRVTTKHVHTAKAGGQPVPRAPEMLAAMALECTVHTYNANTHVRLPKFSLPAPVTDPEVSGAAHPHWCSIERASRPSKKRWARAPVQLEPFYCCLSGVPMRFVPAGIIGRAATSTILPKWPQGKISGHRRRPQV